jgi:hypothetical protein
MTTITDTTPDTTARYTALTFTDLFLDAALSASNLGITPHSIAVIGPHPDDPLTAVTLHVRTTADVNAIATHYGLPAEHTQVGPVYTRSGPAMLAGDRARVTVFAPHRATAPVVA